MASGTADLQRDLGGAIMQSIMGAFLAAGYAAAAGAAISCLGRERHHRGPERADEIVLERGRRRQAAIPQHASKIISSAKTSFIHGQHWAYVAGIIAVVVGALIMYLFFPKPEREQELLASYQAGRARASAQPGAGERGGPAAAH